MPRWTVVRLITSKEFLDLIRDRRTVMLILLLPALLYPLFIVSALFFIRTMMQQTTVMGVVGGAAVMAGNPDGVPPLLDGSGFAPGLAAADPETGTTSVALIAADPESALRDRAADAVAVIPDGFARSVAAGQRPTVSIMAREGDEKSKIAARRLTETVRRWEGELRKARFAAKGLPPDFHEIITIQDPQSEKTVAKKAADELRDTFARVFPLVLMLWLVAGAIQPAIDMTAGEKERGTMETLLISPTARSEIVFGKFLATTVFAFTSVVWNVLWLLVAALLVEWVLEYPIVNPLGLAGCVVLGLPLAMLFSAVCVALGVFAKSTKEGQYYLLPLILVSMPLAFWSMTPGMELDGSNFWIPVTGALLAQRKFLAVSADPLPWGYLAATVAALAVWIGIAVALAVRQFHRESVLFRETGPGKRIGFVGRFLRRGSAG